MKLEDHLAGCLIHVATKTLEGLKFCLHSGEPEVKDGETRVGVLDYLGLLEIESSMFSFNIVRLLFSSSLLQNSKGGNEVL